MESKIEYQVTKSLHRIALDSQTMRDLVNSEKIRVTDKNKAIEFVMERAEPGVDFRFFYYPYPQSYETIGTVEIGYANCDEFLLEDGSVDLEKFRAEVEKELSKKFD